MSNDKEEIVGAQLTERQQAFCEWYASLRVGSEAARRAGYSDKTYGALRAQAARLLTYASVKTEIERIKRERAVEYTREDAVSFLVALINAPIDVFFDDNWSLKPMNEIPFEYRKYVSQVTNKKGETSLKVMDRNEALARLSRLSNWEKDASVNVFVGLPDDEIERKIKELQAEIERSKLAGETGVE